MTRSGLSSFECIGPQQNTSVSNKVLSGMLKVNPIRNESMQDVTFYMLICDFQQAGGKNALVTKKIQRKENTLGNLQDRLYELFKTKLLNCGLRYRFCHLYVFVHILSPTFVFQINLCVVGLNWQLIFILANIFLIK